MSDEEFSGSEVTSESGRWAMVPVWVLHVGLSGAELAVYVSLRSFADRGREAYPKVKTIAAAAGVSERTVERAVARMRELGLVETAQRKAPNGSIVGCHYHLQDNPEAAYPDGDVARGSDTQTPGVASESRQGPRHTDASPPDGDVASTPTGMSGQEQNSSLREESKKRGAKKQSVLSVAPDIFPVTDAMRDYATKYGVGDVERQTDLFLGHHRAKGSKFVDWYQAWQTWVRRVEDYAPSRPAPRKSAGPGRGGFAGDVPMWEM